MRTMNLKILNMRYVMVWVLLVAALMPMPAHAGVAVAEVADGDLDTTFGSGGIVTTDFNNNQDIGRSVALQPDGRIVIGGEVINNGNTDFALARYMPDGSLDPTFDGDGKVTTDFAGQSDHGEAVAIQADGKIVLAGFSWSNQAVFVVARYNGDGSLDATFDSDGKVITPIEQDAYGHDVAIQPDGKIVIVGDVLHNNIRDFALVRYNRDGSLDTGFGANGIVMTDFGNADSGNAVVIQPSDGKIIVAGDSSAGGNGYFALARYNTNGSLDATFDSDGKVLTSVGTTNFAGDLALQADGKILAAGAGEINNAGRDFVLVRYNTDGSLDTTFDSDGKVITDLSSVEDISNAVVVQPDGSILMTGAVKSRTATGLVRYLSNGSLDPTFGVNGMVITEPGFDFVGFGMVLQPDHKIVIAGGGATYPSVVDFAVVRYLGDANPSLVTWTVTKLADTNDGLCNADCSLREAILSSHSGDTIQFAVSGSIVPGSALPVIDKTLLIDGSGQTVRLDGAGTRRIFRVSRTGNLTVKNLTFQNGKAPSPCEWDSGLDSCGGAIYSDGSLTILNSTFSANTAYMGGAISVWSGTANIQSSTFKGNSVEHTGGAISNLLGAVTIGNSTFFGGTADIGGAIFNDLGSLSLTNNTFSNHTAAMGGAVYNSAGSMALVNNILANSTGGEDCYNEYPNAEITLNFNNLIETSAVAPYSCGIPVTKLDPRLGPPANNGGPTQTMALLPGSPAINAGDDAACTVPPVNHQDQRGVTRPQGSHCDIGAYEISYTFLDVPPDHWAWEYIERVYAAGITGGCTTTPLNYCPGSTVTRAQMAIFLLRAEHGSSYTPPAATGMFSDVPVSNPAAPWIEQLAKEKITGGCSATQYCPNNAVTRAQMAIFLLRAEHGFDYAPPAATGLFLDVPKTDFTAPFIEQLANEQITGGCGGGNYCPGQAVTRDQMAIFLVRAFKLP